MVTFWLALSSPVTSLEAEAMNQCAEVDESAMDKVINGIQKFQHDPCYSADSRSLEPCAVLHAAVLERSAATALASG